jgi:hypothetical protein
MKKLILKTLLPFLAVALVGVVFATSCKKDKTDNQSSDAAVSEVSFTPCQGGGDKGFGDSDSVEVTYFSGIVSVTHYNLVVPCDFTTVGTRISTSNDTMRIFEYSDGGYVDCICETDHTFRLNTLKGRWTLVLENSYPEYCQTFNFQ